MTAHAPRERAILFSGPMVRAILDGRKTQTRRPVKLRQFGPSDTPGYDWTFRDRRALWNDYRTDCLLAEVAPYRVGDRLYARETCWQARMPGWVNAEGDYEPGPWMPRWSFDGSEPPEEFGFYWSRRASVHMPKSAARIWLEVERVRVERVRDITTAGALAEGVESLVRVGQPDVGQNSAGRTYEQIVRGRFRQLWLQTYGPGAWPNWAWVYDFRRIEVTR